MSKYRCYERFFFRMQLHEKRYFRLVLVLITALLMVQVLLLNHTFRKFFVLTERLEGIPAQIYKSLNADHL